MRKTALYLAFVMIFGLAAMAQTDASAKKASKTAGKAKTEHQVTGCLSGPDAEGAYSLTNGHYKKGLEVGGTDALKDHVGHEVTLIGTWAKGSEIGEKEANEKTTEKVEEKVGMEKHFKVTEIKMVSDKCTATASTAKSHKSKKSSSTSPTT
ncbi:MAG TPA: hypothetical protein VGR50_07975 [Terriglobales bacterium]|nr:hypothetical protein [Terriglobales bacterium]